MRKSEILKKASAWRRRGEERDHLEASLFPTFEGNNFYDVVN